MVGCYFWTYSPGTRQIMPSSFCFNRVTALQTTIYSSTNIFWHILNKHKLRKWYGLRNWKANCDQWCETYMRNNQPQFIFAPRFTLKCSFLAQTKPNISFLFIIPCYLCFCVSIINPIMSLLSNEVDPVIRLSSQYRKIGTHSDLHEAI